MDRQDTPARVLARHRLGRLHRPPVHNRPRGVYAGLHDRQRLRIQYHSRLHEHAGHDVAKRMDVVTAKARGPMVAAHGYDIAFIYF